MPHSWTATLTQLTNHLFSVVSTQRIHRNYWHSPKQVESQFARITDKKKEKDCWKCGMSMLSICHSIKLWKWPENISLSSTSIGRLAEQRKVTIELKAASLIAFKEVYSSQITQICFGWKLPPLIYKSQKNSQMVFMLRNHTSCCHTIYHQVSIGMLRKWVRRILKTLFLTWLLWGIAGNS